MKYCVEVWCGDCHKQISERIVEDDVQTTLRATCANASCERGCIEVKIIAQAEPQDRDVYSDLHEDR